MIWFVFLIFILYFTFKKKSTTHPPKPKKPNQKPTTPKTKKQRASMLINQTREGKIKKRKRSLVLATQNWPKQCTQYPLPSCLYLHGMAEEEWDLSSPNLHTSLDQREWCILSFFFQYQNSVYKWLNSSPSALVHDDSGISFSEAISLSMSVTGENELFYKLRESLLCRLVFY